MCQDILIRIDMFLTFAMVTENRCQNREMSQKAVLKLILFIKTLPICHIRKFNMCKFICLNFVLLENSIFENEKTKAEISW